MSANVVDVKKISKYYDNKPAIDNLTFSVKQGGIMGLIGSDGAGKTTLIRLLLGLIKASEGEISTLGINPALNNEKINANIGYMPQKFGLYEDLTVIENLNLYADLKGLTQEEKDESFKKLLKFTNLDNFQKRLAGRLSGGMKQKLGLACTLLGRPKILLLDEPSVGVDPISRRELMRLVRELARDMSVLWSTAYLDEAQSFDRIILLNEGKILYEGLPAEFTKRAAGRVFLLNPDESGHRHTLRKILKDGEGVVDAVIQADKIRVTLDKPASVHRFNLKFTPTAPRFEDAVIEALGGCPKGGSELAKNVLISHGQETVIEAKKLTKIYGNFTAAKDITFSIKKGEIFGLLGPNGAGKSTSFKMMCGLSTPTSGEAFIMGANMQKNPTKARAQLGYMAQKFSLFGNLSVMQNLSFFAGVYGLKGNEKRGKIQQMVKIFNLERYLQANSQDLPLGYKQRLALSCSLMHNPPVLFLDEPTSGVDAITRREFWNHINSLVEKGTTVMVTTHFMDEAEYCDRIALIYNGKAIATGSPSELKLLNETMEEAFIRIIRQDDEQESGQA